MKRIIDFFLNEMNPATHRRTIKQGVLAKTGAAFVSLLILVLLFLPTSQPIAAPVAAPHDEIGSVSEVNNGRSDDFITNSARFNHPTNAAPVPARSYGSSQLVKNDTSTLNRQGLFLPLGTTVSGRLLNTVISTDGNSPVIGVVKEDASFGGTVVIARGTKIYGQAIFDESSKRLQIKFSAAVFEDGSQATLSSLALQGDGSAGLGGNYHSGNLPQQAGRFGGNFVSGLAAGMKERQPGGWGGPIEPGSIKNGLLNGLSDAISDQTQALSQQMQNTRAYLEVPAGTPFILYLDQEFSR